MLKKICKDKNAEEAASTVELLCNIEMFLKNIKIDGGKILGIDVHPSGIGISVKYKIGKNEELGTEMNKETEVKRIAEALKLFNANGMRILFGNDKIVEATLEGGKQVNREVVEEIAKLYGVKLTDYKSI